MFSKEEKKKTITVTISFTRSLNYWLNMELDEICEIFSIHVHTNKQLKDIGIKKFEDLFSYSKKQLLNGTGLNRKIGKAAMRQIDEILTKMNLSLPE